MRKRMMGVVSVMLMVGLLSIPAANASTYTFNEAFTTPPLTAGWYDSWHRYDGWENGDNGWVIDEGDPPTDTATKGIFDVDGNRGLLIGYSGWATGTAYQNLPAGNWTSGNVTFGTQNAGYWWWYSDVNLVLKGVNANGNPVTAGSIKFGNFTSSDYLFAKESGGTNTVIAATTDNIRWQDGSGYYAMMSVDFNLGAGTITTTVTERDATTGAITATLTPVSFASWNNAVTLTSVGFEVNETPTGTNTPNSTVFLRDFGITAVPGTATPTFSPDGGNYTSSQSVTINCATPGAIIRYTTDGTTPIDNSTEYGGSITVDHSLILKARAWVSGMDPSAVKTATFTIKAVNESTYTFNEAFTIPPLTPGWYDSWHRYDGWENGDNGWVIDEGDPPTDTATKGVFDVEHDVDNHRGVLIGYSGWATGTAYQNLPATNTWTSGNVTFGAQNAGYWWWFSDVNLVLKGVDVAGNPVTAGSIKFGNFSSSDYLFATESGGTNKLIASTADNIRWQDGSGFYAEMSVDFNLALNSITTTVRERDATTGVVTATLIPVSFASWNNAVALTSVGFEVNGTPVGTVTPNSTVFLRDLGITVTGVPKTATPTFSPDGGNYTSSQSVTISCATPGAVIRYTTDGADPNDNSTVYSSPITVDHALTLKARAWVSGMDPSAIKTATYNFVSFTGWGIPQCTLTIDGDLSDWPASATWSAPFVLWNGPGLSSTTRAKFAWNDTDDLLYVAVETNEATLQPGGHLVIGPTMDNTSIPDSGIGSTQLCFDPQSGNDVFIRNEIQYYVDKYGSPYGGGGIDGVQAKYSYDSGTGLYTYEIAIPLWTDWRLGHPATKQPLSAGAVANVYVVIEDAIETDNGMDLSYLFDGNPLHAAYFDMGASAPNGNAWNRAAALTLRGPMTAADLAVVLAAMDSVTDGPNWNALADLDRDGEITSTDLSILLADLP